MNNNSFNLRGSVKPFDIKNESYNDYPINSDKRKTLLTHCQTIRQEKVIDIPCIINGQEIFTENIVEIHMPSDIHQGIFFRVHLATKKMIKESIIGGLKAKKKWERLGIDERCSVFFKAADLLTKEYREIFNATVMMTQGKTMWQAEIDTVELIDFWRINGKYALDMYKQQPEKGFPGSWNKIEYRPLEGFVASISPFNFAAIMGNLNSIPVLLGNVSLWKPGTSTALTSYRIYSILERAGLPPGCIQFLPSKGSEFAEVCFGSKDFAGLHFTGSTQTFNTIWKQIANNIDNLTSYPRIVGETGGKNYHVLHETGDVKTFVNCCLRGAFEYSGQKCSATSRAYVPKKLWESKIKNMLIEGTRELFVGQPDDPKSFTSCVIDGKSFRKIAGYIDRAKKSKDTKIIVGGDYSDERGWFVQPTIIETTNPKCESIAEEIFGPVLTIYPYPEQNFEDVLRLVDSTSPFALTGSIFANDRYVINQALDILSNASGNFYINDKSTGSVVGQQLFGGSRKSGTNDKSGSDMNLRRWVSMRSIKETFLPLHSPFYPSVDVDESVLGKRKFIKGHEQRPFKKPKNE